MKERKSRRWSSWMVIAVFLAPVALTPATAQNLQEPPGEQSMPVETSDPYENWNRKVFAFNDAVDRWLPEDPCDADRRGHFL